MKSLTLLLLACLALFAEPVPRSPQQILTDYISAVGGQQAVDKLTTRQIEADQHHGPKVILYWQKPNHALRADRRERTGFDGARTWTLSAKGKVKKLAKGTEVPLLMDADPLRYVHAAQLYSELNAAPLEDIDGEKLEVLIAPNNLAATKLYFDINTHLLRRIVESGEVSAYFKNTVDYLDYREVDGVRMPFRIVHTTDEPGGKTEDLRIKTIAHNVELHDEMFSKPIPLKVTFGAKR